MMRSSARLLHSQQPQLCGPVHYELVLTVPDCACSPEVQQSAITALASAASCVQDAFKPYAQQVLPLLYKYLLLTEV